MKSKFFGILSLLLVLVQWICIIGYFAYLELPDNLAAAAIIWGPIAAIIFGLLSLKFAPTSKDGRFGVIGMMLACLGFVVFFILFMSRFGPGLTAQ